MVTARNQSESGREPIMHRAIERIKYITRSSKMRDRAFDKHAWTLSFHLWPWQESRLVTLVYYLVMLDFASTYALLRLSGNKNVFEGGPMASWALGLGGFPVLFCIDILVVSFLILVAITSRFAYTKLNCEGFGRAAFTVVLIPYVVVTTAIIFNNIVLTFL